LVDFAVGGEIYVWDMQRRTCCHKFVDDGCGTRGTSLAVSTGNQYLAAGYQCILLALLLTWLHTSL